MLSFLQRQIQCQIAQDEALMRLASVCYPQHFQDIQPEVNRRKDLFAQRWRESTRTGGPTTTPLCAALESVYQDVVRGWL